MWEIPKIWDGATCIIIGGGPSISKQFNIPEEVVRSVYTKRVGVDAYSEFLSPIHNQHVLAVNMAYRLGPWVDCVFFGDQGFLRDQQMEFFKFQGIRVSSAPNIDNYAGRLKVVARDDKKKQGISWEPNKIAWNGNSGGAAINLAVHFGVKRIILLGFDMKLDENQNQHWHKFYSGNLKTIDGTMKGHLRCFPVIADDLMGKVEIINCSPDSAITSFLKMNFKDVEL